MKAFILAGGLGTRLRPQFGDLPKALAPIGGRPFLVHQLEWLAARGLRRAVILAGVGAERLREALGDWSGGVALEWSVEPEPLGTGGALALATPFVEGPVLLLNGDTLAEVDPWWLERARWEHGALGAVALFRVEEAASRGRVESRDDGRIARFVEKDPSFRGPAWVNGGAYVFSPRLWRLLPKGAFSLERDVLPGLAERGELHGLESPGRFWDIGTPDDWARAEKELAR